MKLRRNFMRSNGGCCIDPTQINRVFAVFRLFVHIQWSLTRQVIHLINYA